MMKYINILFLLFTYLEDYEVREPYDEMVKKVESRKAATSSLKVESEEAFVIGGGMVYRQMMPLADKLYITHIHHSWEDADTFFPEIKESEWKLLNAEHHFADEKNPYNYTFATYGRR